MFNSADVFTSRRTHFNECMYWCRNEEEIEKDIDLTTLVYVDHDVDELYYDRSPDGTFMATEVSDYSSNNNVIAGSFMFDQHVVTIQTNDNVSKLSQNDIVAFDGNVWRVTSISKRKKKRQNQFSKEVSYHTYISLMR